MSGYISIGIDTYEAYPTKSVTTKMLIVVRDLDIAASIYDFIF